MSKLGRTDDVPLVAFRVSAAQRRALEVAAAADGLSVNELARRRTLGEGPARPAPAEEGAARYRVVYDEGPP